MNEWVAFIFWKVQIATPILSEFLVERQFLSGVAFYGYFVRRDTKKMQEIIYNNVLNEWMTSTQYLYVQCTRSLNTVLKISLLFHVGQVPCYNIRSTRFKMHSAIQ